MKFLFFLIIAVLSHPATALAYNSDQYAVGSDSKTPLTVHQLFATIDSLPNPSIESLLPRLKELDPDMFKNYVMMYGSRSLHGSSMTAPRILLSTKDSELVVTFNGNEDQKGFNDLEIMYFDRATNYFKFQEISFRGGRAQASAVNPAKCLACHQSPNRQGVDPRPNWEAYNVWPGAFGSVSHIADVIRPNSPRFNPFLNDLHNQEEAATAEFFTNHQPTHPRYKHLVPYTVYQAFGKPTYYDGPTVVKDGNRMPVLFTHSVGALNARRLARMIKTDYPQIYSKYKYTVLGLVRCFQLALPPETLAWHQKQARNTSIPIKNMTDGMNLIFTAFGINTDDWTTDFNTNGKFAFSDKYGQPTGTSVANFVYADAFEEVWGLSDDYKRLTCAELKEKSLADHSDTSTDFSILPKFAELELAASEPLLNRCVECHVTYGLAPFIPFNDEGALRTALNKNGGELYSEIMYRLGPLPGFHDAMPPQGYFSQEKKQEVIDYIQNLYLNPAR